MVYMSVFTLHIEGAVDARYRGWHCERLQNVGDRRRRRGWRLLLARRRRARPVDQRRHRHRRLVLLRHARHGHALASSHH